MKITLKEKYLSENNDMSYLIFDKQENFNFKAWQFVMLDNGNIKRAYSIASSPNDDFIWFYVKRVSENGMSKYLTYDIKIGNSLELSWPYGHMVCEPKKIKNFLLISIWSWLAPMISIYNYLNETKKYNKILNLYWERYESFFINEVQNIFKSKENENIKNIFYLSREEKQLFKKWYVQSSFDEAKEFLWTENTDIFLCGSPSMVDDSIDILEKLWFKKENMYFEKY